MNEPKKFFSPNRKITQPKLITQRSNMETRTITQVKIYGLFLDSTLIAWSTDKNKLEEWQISSIAKADDEKIAYADIRNEWVNLENIDTYKVGLRIEE